MTVRMTELTWTDYDRKVREDNRVVFVAGSREQHRPHLPMCCDEVIPTAISQKVVERIGAPVAPPIVFGYKSHPRSDGGKIDAPRSAALRRDRYHDHADQLL